MLLQHHDHMVLTVRDIGLERAGDHEHFLTAAQRGWILVTHNRQDFFLLHDAWRRWLPVFNVSTVHAGILVLPHGLPSQTVQLLEDFLLSGLPLSNELYVWRPMSGWTHRL